MFDKSGLSVVEFGRRINCTRENVYNIFDRKSIDTEMLEKIGSVLNYDFFQHFGSASETIKRLEADNKMFKDILEIIIAKNKSA